MKERLYYYILKYSHTVNVWYNTLYLWVGLLFFGVISYEYMSVSLYIILFSILTALNLTLMGYLKFKCYADYIYLYLKFNNDKFAIYNNSLALSIMVEDVGINIYKTPDGKIDYIESNISIYNPLYISDHDKQKIYNLLNENIVL